MPIATKQIGHYDTPSFYCEMKKNNRIYFRYDKQKRTWVVNYSSSQIVRCVRDSNPWPHAWQACILTSWTNAPIHFCRSWFLKSDAKIRQFSKCDKHSAAFFVTSMISWGKKRKFTCSYCRAAAIFYAKRVEMEVILIDVGCFEM